MPDMLWTFLGLSRAKTTPLPLLVVTLLFAASAHAVCHFGRKDGFWVPTAPQGERWQLFDSTCKPKNVIAELSAKATAKQPFGRRPVGVLFLGDSNDDWISRFVCVVLQGEYAGAHEGRDVLHACGNSSTRVVVGQWYIPGVHLQGPYHEELNGSAIERTGAALRAWSQLSPASGGPAQPDVVVVAAAPWDINRVSGLEPQQLNHCTSSITAKTPQGDMTQPRAAFPAAFLHSWVANFTTWAEHVRAKTPKALHMVRTYAMPVYDQVTGITQQPGICSAEAFAQLNAAARYVAQKLGMPVLDMERMAVGVAPHSYLLDLLHMSEALNLEAFNLLMNHYAQHARS